MSRSTVSSRLRAWPRVAVFAVVAVSVTNCAGSARFDPNSYASTGRPIPVQSIGGSSGSYPAYRPVVSRPLPAPSPPAIAVVKNASLGTGYDSRRHRPAVIAVSRGDKPVTKISGGDHAPVSSVQHTKVAVGQPTKVIAPQSPREEVPQIAHTRVASLNQTAQNQTAVQNVHVAIQEPIEAGNVLKTTEPAGGIASFRWPVHGRIISGFGPTSNGTHNDGINLAVPEGTPVMATENGVVAYAGNELKGYGNLVLIRHENGYVSAYANASKLLVKRGDTVKRGQVIAHAGQTGNVNSPQLHFEIRKGSTPVDPSKYLNGA